MANSNRSNAQSLESLLGSAGNVVELLRNQQAGPNVYPGVPAEYTNWRDEQRAWQQSCVLFNQSYHMAELMVEGADALAFLNGLGINSFEGFDRPWRHLARYVDDLRVEQVALGTGYLAVGRARPAAGVA